MATSPNFNWPEPDNTDLVKNGALAIRTAVDAIDSSLVDLKGGTTNQVLAKNSNTDMDFKWVADASGIPATILDAKGDLIAATAADTASRLAVGANGTVLTADSAEATGLKWATPSAGGGGKVLQVLQQFYTTSTSSSSSTFADSGITLNITPSATTSKILILISVGGCLKSGGNSSNALVFRTMRGATSLVESGEIGYNNVNGDNAIGSYAVNYLDSPNTTSSTTYKVQLKNGINASSVSFNNGGSGSTITLMEIGA